MALEIIPYSSEWEEKWDMFVINESVNGTFLQTRNFLNYHPKNRFEDASLLIVNGNNIVAVIPACAIEEDKSRCFYSHKGSTFGGIILDKHQYNITTLKELFPLVEKYIKDKNYEKIYMKCTSNIFSKREMDLLDYFFYEEGYQVVNELSFYIECDAINDDIFSAWSSGRRRDYKYSLKNDLKFMRIENKEELEDFYNILKKNLLRHNAKPVHTLAELIEFKNNRLIEIVDFYGVFYETNLIAGSMVFKFGKDVFHTQYLAQDIRFAKMYPMNFLNYNLIKLAKTNGYKKFSFGISTEEKGKFLNTGLAIFKEGFGTKFCNNRSYLKTLM